MSKLIAAARSFVAGEEGATMVEYGLMVALIAVALLATITTMSGSLKGLFTTVSNTL